MPDQPAIATAEPDVVVPRRQTTVRDLIAELSALPQDALVATVDNETGYDFDVHAVVDSGDVRRSSGGEAFDFRGSRDFCDRRPLHEGCEHEQIVVIGWA